MFATIIPSARKTDEDRIRELELALAELQARVERLEKAIREGYTSGL